MSVSSAISWGAHEATLRWIFRDGFRRLKAGPTRFAGPVPTPLGEGFRRVHTEVTRDHIHLNPDQD